MAIDDRNKRRSMMARGLPSNSENLPTPDGSIDAPDRHQRLYRYRALTWAGAVATSLGVVISSTVVKAQLLFKSGIEKVITMTSEVE